MLRTTVSKLRHVCALAYFVPRLLRGNIRYVPGRFEKLSVSVQRRVDKSTDSGSKDESDYERCQRIIDRAFSPNPPHTHYIPDTSAKHKESLMHMVTPEMPSNPENQCEKCQRIIKEIFGEDSNAGDKKSDVVDPICIPITELQATTAKENVETLAQKVEVIDETPLVEAAAKSKIEGFNAHPKVLGNRKKRRTIDKITILNFSSDRSGRRKGTSRKDSNFDELARRCLDSPSGQIDERILKEMEKLGVPPSTRRGSRRTATDVGIIQPDIMKRPRRPVEKTELDFIAKLRRLEELESLNNILPPPFELMPVKANSVNLISNYEDEDNSLCVERIQPIHLTDPIESRVENMFENENLTNLGCGNKEERPPQQLLGQMTAAVMSGESDMMSDKNKTDHSTVKDEERLKSKQRTSVDLNEDDAFHRELEVVIRNSTGEKISLQELKEMEKEDAAILHEKLASTNLLTDLVDPSDISPRAVQTNLLNNYNEAETLRNLLQTRLEHLTKKSTKPYQFKENAADIAEKASPAINFEADGNQEINILRMERIKPPHLKEDLNIISKETSPHTEPGILIREFNKPETMKESDEQKPVFLSYSPTQEPLTPHQYYEQLSFISRESEPDTIHNYEETDYSGPERAPAPSQILDTVGVIPKDGLPSEPNKSLTDKNNMQNVTDQSDHYQILVNTYDKKVRDSDAKAFESINLVEEQPSCGPQFSPHTLLSSSELSRRALDEEESEVPVIAVEMGRIESAPLPDPIPDQQMLMSGLSKDLIGSASNREPILKETEESSETSRTVTRETLLNPLFDKGTVPHVTADTAKSEMSPTTLPKEHPQKPLSLSEMLKRVRDRNRMELCKEFVELKMQSTQVDPVVGGCGKKNPPCPPPAPTCPPPPPPPPPPQKPPCPNPCKPKCPPGCPPAPCGEPKTKCPPPKKSPCDKFKKTKCSSVQIQDTLTLLLYLGPQLHIPQKTLLPVFACALNIKASIRDSKTEAMERIFTKLQDLCSIVLFASFRGDIEALESVLAGKEGMKYARTYDPWSPIPSWPIPVKEEKKKFACPKEGCKVIPPKCNYPCKNVYPCGNLPRHNKFTVVDFIIQQIGKKIVFDVGEF
ncbi:titin-like [Ostrinia nubilalis]|uniref:titin-like n=1 Tax=Ostrinia nubilalis TaxID=29057 RepID=UPI003082487B